MARQKVPVRTQAKSNPPPTAQANAKQQKTAFLARRLSKWRQYATAPQAQFVIGIPSGKTRRKGKGAAAAAS
jgi:hypothetical protein